MKAHPATDIVLHLPLLALACAGNVPLDESTEKLAPAEITSVHDALPEWTLEPEIDISRGGVDVETKSSPIAVGGEYVHLGTEKTLVFVEAEYELDRAEPLGIVADVYVSLPVGEAAPMTYTLKVDGQYVATRSQVDPLSREECLGFQRGACLLFEAVDLHEAHSVRIESHALVREELPVVYDEAFLAPRAAPAFAPEELPMTPAAEPEPVEPTTQLPEPSASPEMKVGCAAPLPNIYITDVTRQRRPPPHERCHFGIDMDVSPKDRCGHCGDQVKAIFSGRARVLRKTGYGQVVEIRNGPWEALYGHIFDPTAPVRASLDSSDGWGDVVQAGDAIGYTSNPNSEEPDPNEPHRLAMESVAAGNSSGAHLHLELRYNGRLLDPGAALDLMGITRGGRGTDDCINDSDFDYRVFWRFCTGN